MAPAWAGAGRRGVAPVLRPSLRRRMRRMGQDWPAMENTDAESADWRSAAGAGRSAELALLRPLQEAAARHARAVDDLFPSGQLVRTLAQQDRRPAARDPARHLPDDAGRRDRVRSCV